MSIYYILKSNSVSPLVTIIYDSFVECVSIRACIPITIAKVANTNPIVPSVKSSSSVLEVPHMKCPVVMPFIGNASDNWRRMIRVVPSAKRRPKRENE